LRINVCYFFLKNLDMIVNQFKNKVKKNLSDLLDVIDKKMF